MVLLNKRGANLMTLFVHFFVCPIVEFFILLLSCSQVPVWAVLNYTETDLIERELLLAKVSILGPEYLEDQLLGGPSHEPRRNAQGRIHDLEIASTASYLDEKLTREMTLAQNFEHSKDAAQPTTTTEAETIPVGDRTLTASEALRIRHQHLGHIRNLADQFAARIVDVSENSVIVEMSGKTKRVEAFLRLLKPFGLIESARSGEWLLESFFKPLLLIFIIL